MDLLRLNCKTDNIYEGMDLWPAYPGSPVFGGQIIGQSLLAAVESEGGKLFPISYHINFHKPTVVDKNIKYLVKELKRGKKIITKGVEVYQDDKLLSTVEVLLSDEPNIDYEYTCKNILLQDNELYDIKEMFKIKSKPENEIGKGMQAYINNLQRILCNIKIEFGMQKENVREYKFTFQENLDKKYKIPLLALISDFFMMEPALNILAKKNKIASIADVLKNFMVLSLDHKIHFLRTPKNTVRVKVEIKRICDQRVLSICSLFDEENNMLGTAIQDGMIIKRINK
ncbi:acyl-CoA thioesterase II [Spraguea lophii 42_110]|uniref:Acyl-CoA thioesterase II n=1 Tax=Spraguea lophii (strain 42_110) TaxID=1358809 RepID=S7WBL6_SPRLO|nr:acyl-CoA thioesterase II [Spraguea lophii 42_110]